MHRNTLFFWLCLLISGFMTLAQTKIIAHESHGGGQASFSLEKEDCFGQPREFDYRLDSVIKHERNAVVEIYHRKEKGKCLNCRLVDTTQQHPIFNNPEVSLDSMQRLFPDVVFVGFDKVTKEKKVKLKAGLNTSFEPLQEMQRVNGVKKLIGLTIMLFLLLATLLWKQSKVDRE